MSEECNCGIDSPTLCRDCGMVTECTAIDLCSGCITKMFTYHPCATCDTPIAYDSPGCPDGNCPSWDYPDDMITGYPDHYIVNGDPSSCGCPEHENWWKN